MVSYHQLLSGPLRPSVCSTVFAGSAETIRRCRTIVVDEEEREQKVGWEVGGVRGGYITPSLSLSLSI